MRTRQLPERWRDVPGYEGKYQVSNHGRIRRIWAVSGRTTVLRPFRRKSHGVYKKTLMVNLTDWRGRPANRSVHSLVADAWLGGTPAGMYCVHRNGLHEDNSVDNLLMVTPEQLGLRYGGSANRRPVRKIARDGTVLAFYPSARAAARAEGPVSYQTVMDRCNGQVKKEWAWDCGFSWRWDDDD
ncbi:MAG: HNH endonuclease [Oscillospiraceae bacterium]|nr:HNH endonuclease [Oscillospiraceae bacterium]